MRKLKCCMDVWQWKLNKNWANSGVTLCSRSYYYTTRHYAVYFSLLCCAYLGSRVLAAVSSFYVLELLPFYRQLTFILALIISNCTHHLDDFMRFLWGSISLLTSGRSISNKKLEHFCVFFYTTQHLLMDMVNMNYAAGILHTIFFHRTLSLVRPKDVDCDFLEITYVSISLH